MKQVVLYGAGKKARDDWGVLNERYHPICFCDADKAKWGTELFGLPILSPEEVLTRYPGAYFVVTLSRFETNGRFAAIDYLMERYAITPDRILNYEDRANYDWGRGCPLTRKEIYFQHDKLQNCCENFRDTNVPFSDFCDSPSATIEAMLEMKRMVLDYIRHFPEDESMDSKAPSYYEKRDGKWLYTPYNRPKMQQLYCRTCREVREGYWPRGPFTFEVLQVSSNTDSRCNFKCPYCCEAMPGYKPGPLLGGKVAETIEAIAKAGLFCDTPHYCISIGEPALYPQLDQLVGALPGAYYQILTNASVYSDIIQNAISQKGEIVASIDAGTETAFRRIKGVDCFNNVKRNILKYREFGSVVLKFIIMPGMNDTVADVNGFVDFCKEVHPLRVEVVRDWLADGFDYDAFQYSPETMAVIALLAKRLEAEKFPVVYTVFPNNFREILRKYEALI